MNTLRVLFFVSSTICILSSNDAVPTFKNDNRLIIRGRVIFPGDSKVLIESGAKLTIKLQDTSLADAPAKVIATGTAKAVRFPMAFAIRYPPSQVKNGLSYSLSVTINSKKNELLYINDVNIPVIPLGANRTKFIDAPVIRINQTSSASRKNEWPELVGAKGEEAVKIIKQETGFTNVVIVKEGSPVTLDYRTDRVRVFIDNNGIVKSAPTIG